MNAISSLLKEEEPNGFILSNENDLLNRIGYNQPESNCFSHFEIINPIDTPTTNQWALLELRKISLAEAEILWQIGFDFGNLITRHGHVGGKIQTEPPRAVILNQSGKDIQSQALQEARKRYIDKIREGYTPPGSNIEPMLTIMGGKEYEPGKTKLKFPVGVENKIDGVRMWIRISHGLIEGFSRGNIPFTRMRHLFYEAHELLNYLPYNCAIEGEMCHPSLKFQELISIVRTTDFDHQLLSMLELYIFDIYLIDNPPFEQRRCILEKALFAYRYDKFGYSNQGETMIGGRHEALADNRTREEHSAKAFLYPIEATPPGKTKLFATILYHANSHEEIQKIHDYYVSLGFEGSMIKKYSNGASKGSKDYIASQYLFGKGTHILKYKYFTTKEARCVEVRDAKGREEGCALLVLEDELGRRFSVRMKGSFDRRRVWLQHPELVLNKPVTYKYQELTDDGIPRFPIGLEVRDYEPGFNPLVIEYKDPHSILEVD